eukprot:TRINITY_DN2529_c3_g1_i1.p1 TRINITY_DN2529_c3_g1~~TRINITY_DN2529_c3_g1_i1.p1  ORF type:complete len:564 (+),score=122.29 TRINITY_DN2529_c3_g1_i1:349-2040(+)
MSDTAGTRRIPEVITTIPEDNHDPIVVPRKSSISASSPPPSARKAVLQVGDMVHKSDIIDQQVLEIDTLHGFGIEEGGMMHELTNDDDPGVDFSDLSNVKVSTPSPTERFSWSTLYAFLGPAFFVSIGYLDPGNWATDIEGGSEFGYDLIWVLLMSNLMALLLQTLASRLGLVARLDLAQACRSEYPYAVCTVLWGLCELAIAATDLAEVLGTAIGLQLLFGIPLLIGVVLTALDTLIFLMLQRYGIRKMEAAVLFLLVIIVICFIIEMVICKPDLLGIVEGLVPRINSKSLYVSIGILGATVMPHNFYLHSSVVMSRDIGGSTKAIEHACFYNFLDTAIALNIAFFVNAAILIVAAAVFFKEGIDVTEIGQAHDLLEGLLDSKVAPMMFGVGLICAGQSSTLTGTLAGQIVMEGFLDMRMTPWKRRLMTRLIAILPAVIVIVLVGEQGTYQLLIFSQVVLSLQLPFAILPLIKFTSSERLMGSFKNTFWVAFFAWVSACIVILLNMWMIAESLVDFKNSSPTLFYASAFLFTPIIISLLLLMAWLVWQPSKVEPVTTTQAEE